MTRLSRYATAACDSAESTTSRVVIYKKSSTKRSVFVSRLLQTPCAPVLLRKVSRWTSFNFVIWSRSAAGYVRLINQTAPRDLSDPLRRSATLKMGATYYSPLVSGHRELYDLSSPYFFFFDTDRRSSAWRGISSEPAITAAHGDLLFLHDWMQSINEGSTYQSSKVLRFSLLPPLTTNHLSNSC